MTDTADDVDGWWARAVSPHAKLGPARTRQAGWALTAEEVHRDYARVGRVAVGRGFVLRRSELQMCGVSDAERRRRLRSGDWSLPVRGFTCVVPSRADGRPSATDAELRVAATVRSRPGTAASHEGAAVLFGLPVLHRPDRVQLTIESPSHGGGWPGYVVHSARVAPAERTSWFGIPVLAVPRTVVDIARRSGVAAGLVTADAALREGLTTEGELARALVAARRRPGVLDAARAVELVRAGAESPLESLLRLCMIDGGISEPIELQVPLDTDRGTFRVDLFLRRWGVVIEADGQLKYRGNALWREKRRQDALGRAGYVIVRVTWHEVTTVPDEVVARIRAACTAPRPLLY